VELTLGSEGQPPIPEGGRLRNDNVQASVELDEILDSLDPYTRKAFRTWQQDLGSSVQGRGQDLNDALGNLPGFAESGGDLMQVLDEQKGALRALVRDTGTVFGALTEREGQLRRLVDTQDDVFSAIAAEREAWADTFKIFPTFLDESKSTFQRLEDFSVKAQPVVADLEPAMRDLRPTLRDLGTLGPDLRRFFKAFGPLITLSNESMPATREVLTGLKPLLGEAGPFLGQLNPILEYIGVHAYTLSDMFANLGVATAAKTKQVGKDQVGHYLRQFGPLGAEGLAIQPQRTSGNRGNAYLNPLGVIQGPNSPKFKILPSFDCENANGEKEPGGEPATPGCKVQQPFSFRGSPTSRYPRLTEESYFKK
jgi:ABC-type transporter Mla subunit MlaD